MKALERPTGTVTFLFTDIEGSTRLLHELGERYAEVLAEHRRLLRAAFARRGGVEVDTQGDAFFVAFSRAGDAVAAARDAQLALAEGPVRVRIGIHTGEPVVTEEGYVGVDVHRAARIASAGHGGQVLVSEATRRLLADAAELRDLGEHRLKDLSAPQRLYQLGDADFPPLKTLYQTNLPTPANPLIGRKRDLVEVARLLGSERARVVTVTGPGGIGKTRFSLAAAAEVGDQFPEGVWFVDLAPIRDAALVLPTIGATLGARVDVPVHIGDKQLLLLLDNLEQVVDAAGDLAALLAACPRMQLLTTSREPLRIAAEREYPLRPLPESPAVELFRERARAGVPDVHVEYELAAEICERLDHLPLAIELAAARVKVLDPAALLERLERRLPLLATRARDVPERQRALHSTIAWSYELLPAEDQQLFRRLSVFARGCTLATAEAVCDGDVDALESLVDKSLLRRRGDRFLMLETIREFAGERLDDSDEADEVRRRHAEFFLALAESANLASDASGEQRHDLVVVEQHNARAALEWALGRGELELGLRLAVALENYWVTSNPQEGMRWFESFLEGAAGVPPTLLARALRSYGSSAYILGEYERGIALFERSLALFRSLGDERGIAILLHRLAIDARRRGDAETARSLVEESLARHREAGFGRGETQALTLLAQLAYADGEHERALELLERSAAIAEGSGFSWWHCITLLQLAMWRLRLGGLDEAETRARAALGLAHRMADRQHVVYALALLSRIAAAAQRSERAGRLWGALEAEETRGRIGQWEEDRQRFAAAAAVPPGPEYDRALDEGRRLSLEEAVDEALRDA
jgi:predicted ATPase